MSTRPVLKGISVNIFRCIYDQCWLAVFLFQSKYKQTAEMDRASYTTVIDTPDIIHAQQMKNIVSQVGYWTDPATTLIRKNP